VKPPVAIDLCCGLGGWAEGLKAKGWHVIGFDIDPDFGRKYPGDEFRAEDVRYIARHVHDSRSRYGLSRSINEARLVVASPPCEEFSRHDMPWTAARNPPAPDLSIWRACEAIAREVEAPLILENVRGAQRFVTKASGHFGSQYLWGNVPALLPNHCKWKMLRQKQSMSSSARPERAKIPIEMASFIAEAFL
jgi:hypothetical protein